MFGRIRFERRRGFNGCIGGTRRANAPLPRSRVVEFAGAEFELRDLDGAGEAERSAAVPCVARLESDVGTSSFREAGFLTYRIAAFE